MKMLRLEQTNLRDKLILESTQEKDWGFGDLRQHIFTGPILVAETCQIPCWGKDTSFKLVLLAWKSCREFENILWDQLANAQESVL